MRLKRKVGYKLISAELVESAFENPLDFVPERWTTQPQMVRDKQAVAPFSLGQSARAPHLFYVTTLLVEVYIQG